MKTFWLAFLTLLVAELGDKTQLAVISMSSSTRQPLQVFAGGALALVLVTLLGVVGGEALVRLVPEAVIRRARGGGLRGDRSPALLREGVRPRSLAWPSRGASA
jgi:putative Ca2+/H+ antiporter (TMEM165/GDT1 family)